ncbi:hypothetical protein CVT26_004901 [Gymnopilus dilepis]|uniref:Uncharacterized protein n=1 Tax=Gymnopilus dilepis TaxID=231916 RepID=A0A409YIW9_9AGAR|nr:hypothetical protein CVT26_004901 [Gymnopilus dilepis]
MFGIEEARNIEAADHIRQKCSAGRIIKDRDRKAPRREQAPTTEANSSKKEKIPPQAQEPSAHPPRHGHGGKKVEQKGRK